jgi:hypothetical protein
MDTTPSIQDIIIFFNYSAKQLNDIFKPLNNMRLKTKRSEWNLHMAILVEY